MTNERIIITKRGRQWKIPEGMKGTPIEAKWPDTNVPDSLKGALIYNIDGEEVIARQINYYEKC